MFNEATVLHHRYVMRQPRHDAHVMRHQQQSQTAPGDNIRQQVEDARLGDGIEIGRRLVGDDKGRAAEQGESDHHPLQHAPAHFKRVALQQRPRIVQTDLLHRCQQHGVIRFTTRCPAGFPGMRGHGLQRVKGAARVLHDGGDGRPAQLFAVHRNAVEKHPAGGLPDAGRQQAQRGGAGQRFSATTAAEQRQLWPRRRVKETSLTSGRSAVSEICSSWIFCGISGYAPRSGGDRDDRAARRPAG